MISRLDALLVIGPSRSMPSAKMVGNMIELNRPTAITLYIATLPVLSMVVATSTVLIAANSASSLRGENHAMIHEPAKWAGWQSTTAAAQHLERLKQMQDQIYRILSSRSGKPLRQIIKDTKRTDFYLDAQKAMEYGLIDAIVAGELPAPRPSEVRDAVETSAAAERPSVVPIQQEAARERSASQN